MTDPADNENEDDIRAKGKKGKGESDGNFGSGTVGIAASNEENIEAKGKKGKGETDGSFGDGKAGAGAGIGTRLTTNKKVESRHLVGSDLVAAIVEFFADLPMKASANLEVVWEAGKKGFKAGYAIVNSFLSSCEKMMREYTLSSGTRVLVRKGQPARKPNTPAPSVTLTPSGPTGSGNQ